MRPPLPNPGARWALYLDFDGTLAELVAHPELVRVSPQLVGLLERVSDRLDGALAVVSGRPISSLDRFLHPSRHAAAGLHGLELRACAGEEILGPPAVDPALDEARRRLEVFVGEREGLLLEDKGASVALHYRGAAQLAEACRAEMSALVGSLPHHHVLDGKMVLELKSRTMNKGEAVRAFARQAPFGGRVPVFAGDDRTDEDAFDWVNANHGISIKVGAGASAARYRLADVSALHRWLRELESALGQEDER